MEGICRRAKRPLTAVNRHVNSKALLLSALLLPQRLYRGIMQNWQAPFSKNEG